MAGEIAKRIAEEVIEATDKGMWAAWPVEYIAPLAREYLKMTEEAKEKADD